MLHAVFSARVSAGRFARLLAAALLGVVLLNGAQADTAPLKVGIATSPQIDALKIAAKEVVVMVIVRASQIVPVVKIAVKEAVPRKKMKGDCGLMIASATAMKRGVNVLGISALSISRPSRVVAMSSH